MLRLYKHLNDAVDHLGVVMSSEGKKTNYKPHIADEMNEVVVHKPPFDGCLSIPTDWLNPVILSDQEIGQLGAIVDFG